MSRPRQVLKPSSLTNQAIRERTDQARQDEMEAKVLVERRRGAGIGIGGSDPAGTAAGIMAAHTSHADPHPQYVKEADLDVLLGAIGSGTYTPIVTAFANATDVDERAAHWIRIGNIVTVSGVLGNVDITAAGVETDLRLTLPAASNFPDSSDGASGVVAHALHLAEAGTIRAVPEDSHVSMRFISIATGPVSGLRYTYTYRIYA